MPTARETPCLGCPFEGRLDFAEAAAVLEGFPRHDPACEVLCHMEGFEQGEYRLCAGFRANAVRLGLLKEAVPDE